MKIVVDALPFITLPTGIGRYVRLLYTHLHKLGVEIFYFVRELSPQMPSPPQIESWSKRTDFLWKLPWPVVTFLRTIFWLRFERRFLKALKNKRDVILHEPALFPFKTTLPQVLTLHDLTLLLRPQDHPKERVAFFKLFFSRRLPYANHIISVSDFTRREALRHLPLRPEKISVVPLAVAPNFKPASQEEIRRVLERYRLPSRYFLFVGTIDPRKNLDLVLKGLARLDTAPPLVIAGWKGWGHESLAKQLNQLGLKERVFLLDYVSDEDLKALYSGAQAFFYPSLYEGFGLPVLEAMACGCPVVTSNVASLPEVAGDAAILIDPSSEEEMVHAMEAVSDPKYREELIQRGFRQAQKFSWERTARETLEIFKKVVEQG